MGYKFRIEYKPRATNRVADALSRRADDQPEEIDEASLFMVVSQPMPDILELLRVDVRTISELTDLCASIEAGTAPRGFRLRDGLLYRDHRLVVASTSEEKTTILYKHHSTPSAGHPGVDRTFRRLASSFYRPNMRKDV